MRVTARERRTRLAAAEAQAGLEAAELLVVLRDSHRTPAATARSANRAHQATGHLWEAARRAVAP